MSRNKKPIVATTEFLKECFDYVPETGLLYWKSRPLKHFPSHQSHKRFNTMYAGKIVGSLNNNNNYLSTRFRYNGSIYNHLLHRIIWKMVTGNEEDLAMDIDHIDGDGSNNKWDNLRLVTHEENGRNCKRCSNNTPGFNGVHEDKKWGGYIARLYITLEDGTPKRVYVGKFKTPEEADSALAEYRKKHGYTDRHGT